MLDRRESLEQNVTGIVVQYQSGNNSTTTGYASLTSATSTGAVAVSADTFSSAMIADSFVTEIIFWYQQHTTEL